MKKRIAVIMAMVAMSIFSWSQENRTIPDAKKSGDDMEIMRGILESTLKLYAPKTSILNRFDINSFYLRGQGAVFTISTAGLRDYYPAFATATGSVSANDSPAKTLKPLVNSGFDSISDSQESESWPGDISQPASVPRVPFRVRNYRIETMDDGSLLTYVRSDEQNIAMVTMTNEKGELSMMPIDVDDSSGASEVTNQSKIAGKIWERFGMTQERFDQVLAQLTEMQEKTRKVRDEQSASWQKLRQTIAEIQIPLIDTLANYGDSLSAVRSEEYINLALIIVDEFDFNSKKQLDIITARKSWITDYKAGLLTLDEFRQKVLQYNQ